MLARYADFFALFGDFDGYLAHFLFQDFDDGGRVRFVLPFDEFVTRPVPRDAETYREYMARSTELIRARNQRIAALAAQHLPATI